MIKFVFFLKLAQKKKNHILELHYTPTAECSRKYTFNCSKYKVRVSGSINTVSNNIKWQKINVRANNLF